MTVLLTPASRVSQTEPKRARAEGTYSARSDCGNPVPSIKTSQSEFASESVCIVMVGGSHGGVEV